MDGVVSWQIVQSRSRRIDPDDGRRGFRQVVRLAAACKGLDDEHAATTVWARARQHGRLELVSCRGTAENVEA